MRFNSASFGDIFANRIGSASIMAMLLPLLQGCVTAEMWVFVPPSTVSYSGIVGVTKTPVNGSPSEERQLLISYRDQGAPDILACVPLDPMGAPNPPFNYTGERREIDEIIRSIRPRSDSIAWSALKPVSAPTPEHLLPPQSFWNRFEEGVVITGYKLGPHDEPILISDAEALSRVPEGYHILILPRKLGRPVGQVTRERWMPILLTPLTLAADLVVTPLGAILAIIRVIPWKC